MVTCSNITIFIKELAKFASMKPEELQQAIQTVNLPQSFELSSYEYISNVHSFLKTQFLIIELAGANYEKSPAWGRLQRFYEAVQENTT